MRRSLALAMAVLLLLPPPSAASQGGATLAVAPPAGPYGTVFQPVAAGLPPGVPVVAIIRLPTGEERSHPDPEPVGPDGTWLPPAWFAEEGEPVGRYGVYVVQVGPATRLASGAFTVTGPAADEPASPQVPVQLPATASKHR